jgi:hypothetical protein
MVEYLIRKHYTPINRPLRACQPRDLIDQVTALCRYRGEEPQLNRENLDAACEAYFLDDSRLEAEALRHQQQERTRKAHEKGAIGVR